MQSASSRSLKRLLSAGFPPDVSLPRPCRVSPPPCPPDDARRSLKFSLEGADLNSGEERIPRLSVNTDYRQVNEAVNPTGSGPREVRRGERPRCSRKNRAAAARSGMPHPPAMLR